MDHELDLHRKVKASLYEFFCKDMGLLELSVNERSISHKLAEYLQHQFEGLNVDCEYNRHGADVKTQPAREQIWSDDRDAKTVYPDIIVHRRGNDESNLLVIEVKKTEARTDDISRDKKKLRAFTDPQCGFKYRLGILLVFNVSNQSLSSAACFREGEECECAFCKSLEGFDGQY